MNVLYTGAYFVSLLSLIILMYGVFGFSFSIEKRNLAFGTVLVLAGAVTVLLLEDPSNRIFVSLFVQIIFAVSCFEGKKRVLAEVSFLVHFTLLSVEALIQSVIAMIWYAGIELNTKQEAVLDTICEVVKCLVIVIFTLIVSRYTQKVLQHYLKQFNWRHVLYYILWIFSSGIGFGFASGIRW